MANSNAELDTAIALHRAGRLQEAEAVYRRLVDHVAVARKAHAALGQLLSQQRRFAEARAQFEQLVACTPDDFLAHKLLADACSDEGDIEASKEHYRQVARCRPQAWFWKLRAEIASPVVFESVAAIDAYRAALSESLKMFEAAPPTIHNIDELAASGVKPPLSLAFHGRNDRPIKELFARIFAERLPADLPRRRQGKPHVGFVVTAGNEGVFLRGMAGVLRRLDAQQLKVTFICSPAAKATAERMGLGVEYLCIGGPLTGTIEAIRAANVDILYFWEIGTDCVNYFLPLFRLAPVQCTSWGWPVTSGIAEVDYFLSSQWLEPPGAEAHYTERLVLLANIPNSYAPPGVIVPAISEARSQLGLRSGDHIYFCGQNPRKLHPDFDALIGRILRCDGRGQVYLIEASRPAVTEALRRRMEKTLPDCVERVHWLRRMTSGEYFQWLAAADCVLDTPHYCGGGNSTYDALGVGAPVVTLTGAYHRGRYTTAAYRRMGLDDCIADTPDAYVDIALRLTSDGEFRSHVAHEIAQRHTVLFDQVAAAVELQNWFLEIIGQVR